MNIRARALAAILFAAGATAFTVGNSAQAQITITVDSKTHNSITITARGMQPDLVHPNDPNNPQILGYIREKPAGACPDPLVNGFFDRAAAGREGYQLFTRLANSRHINEITNWKIPGDPPDPGTISTPLMPNTEYCILVAAFSGVQSSRRHLIITETTNKILPPVITVMHTPPEEGASAMPLDIDAARIAPSIPAMGEAAALNSRVVLSVTASDPDTGDAVSTYTWMQVDGPMSDTEVTGDADDDPNDAIIDLTTSQARSGEGFSLAAGITASFTAPAFVGDDGMPTAAGMDADGNPRTTPLLLHFRVVAADNDNDEISEPAYITITVAAPSTGSDTAAVDRAILPHVIRALERQVHNSIYQRIQQRQRADGKWK